MKTKNLLTAAVALLMAGAAQAQTNTWNSYSFIEAQGGVQLTSTNAPMDKLITPTAALSFGHYLTSRLVVAEIRTLADSRRKASLRLGDGKSGSDGPR